MAEYSEKGEVGIITLRNGDLNPLSYKTRCGVEDGLERANNNCKVKAIVICGGGKNFSVGADISEFAKATQLMRVDLVSVLSKVEASRKPVVAAIWGYALGGGFELALSCHYRVASVDAEVGFPEVQLGILPGAGGTQRFPRIAGIEPAMQWITTGKHYKAADAANLGVFDRLVQKGSDVLSEAIRFAGTIAHQPIIGKRACDRRPPDHAKVDEIAAKYLKIAHKKSRGQYNVGYCVQAIRQAAVGTFEEGMKKERDLTQMLITSGQSVALRYAFFAQRQIQKWSVPGTNLTWRNSKPREVKLGAVIGLGTMGRGIAINFLVAGIPVIVTEMNEKFLQSGLKAVHGIIDDMERRKFISSQQNAMMKSAVRGTSNYADLKDVDLVIEAVYESIEVKEKIFKTLDKHCKPSAILATNTSALNIDEIASFTSRPDKVMGMHFFAPANLMALLENIFGAKTSGETIATCMDIGKRMKKVTVLVGNCRGFVGNRMYFNYTNESDYLLEEGATPESVDKALTDYGFAMGRYVVGDLSGNDIGYRMRMALGVTAKQQPPGVKENERGGMRYCPLSDYLCEKGRYGLKVRKGWYDYPSGRTPQHSPEVSKIITDYRQRIGVRPRRIDHQEVLERMLYALINEGFRILDEGFAATPMDIDMVWINGYAWPKHTGGPMFYAHTIGLPKLLERLEFYHKKFGDGVHYFKPSDMLIKLVREYGNPDISEWMKCSAANALHSSKSKL